MNDFYEEDTALRLEALRLANQVAHQHNKEALELAEKYYGFLTGTVSRVNERPNVSRPMKLTVKTDPAVVDHALKAYENARLSFTSKSGQGKADVYAQIMAIVHESGVFADPVLLASALGRVIIDAKSVGE